MMGMVLRRSLRVGCLPGQENQGGLAPPPEPRLALFAISIVVMSALGTMTMTTTMMAIFVGAEKSCVQSTWARGRVCALLPRRQGAWAADAGPGRPLSRSTVTPLVLFRDKGHIMSLSPPSVTPSSSHTVTTTVDNQHQWQRQSGNNQLKVTGDERAVVNAVIEACQNALSEMTVEGRVAVPSAGGDVSAQGDGGSLEMDRLCSMVRESEWEALERTLVYMKQ